MSSKIRSSAIFSCCFRSSTTSLDDDGGDLLPSPLPDLKDKCQNLISRIGRHCHRRHQSADFRYDPLSYALNFDEGNGGNFLDLDDEEEFRYRNFASRLPASPPAPPRSSAAAAVGTACT